MDPDQLRSLEAQFITDPESIHWHDLLEMSLGQLSRSLPMSTKFRPTINTFLRWLDVHREADPPPRTSDNWDETIARWAKELKSRDFRKKEIIAELEDYKAHVGTQKSRIRRYLPTSRDIHDAFNGDGQHSTSKGKKEREKDREKSATITRGRDRGSSWRLEPNLGERDTNMMMPIKKKSQPPDGTFDGPPPKNYICNRCNKPGHHLQACPTNMDPAYDCAPDPTYKCEVCKVFGEHFKSLCPQNFDPYSIHMKRRALGIKTPSSKNQQSMFSNFREIGNAKSRVFPRDTQKESRTRVNKDRYTSEVTLKSTEKKLQTGRLSQPSGSSSSPSPSKSLTPSRRAKEIEEKLQALENVRTEMLVDDVYDFQELLDSARTNEMTNDRKRARNASSSEPPAMYEEDSPTPSKRARLESRMGPAVEQDHADMFEAEFYGEEDVEDNDREMVNLNASSPLHNASEEELLPYPPAVQEESREEQQLSFPLSPLSYYWTNPEDIDLISEASSGNDEFNHTITAKAQSNQTYSDAVRKLIMRFPRMSEQVNIKKRITALDMWKKEDERRRTWLSVAP